MNPFSVADALRELARASGVTVQRYAKDNPDDVIRGNLLHLASSGQGFGKLASEAERFGWTYNPSAWTKRTPNLLSGLPPLSALRPTSSRFAGSTPISTSSKKGSFDPRDGSPFSVPKRPATDPTSFGKSPAGGGPPKPPINLGAAADDADDAADVIGSTGKRFPFMKLGAASVGAPIATIAAWNLFKPKAPKPKQEIPEYNPAAVEGDVSATSVYGSVDDDYAKAQRDLQEFYRGLLEQSAQDTARREQMINSLYNEQRAYNNQLIAGMDAENDLRKAELDRFHADMQEDYQAMGSGGQGFAMAGTEGDRARISDEAIADANADERYFSKIGGNMDDFMRAAAQAGEARRGEMIRDVQAQGAEDQRSLRNTAIEAMLGGNLDRASNYEKFMMQQQMDLAADNASKRFVPVSDRPEALANAQKFMGDVEITLLPVPIQNAMRLFMASGDAGALNYAISTFQGLRPEQVQ